MDKICPFCSKELLTKKILTRHLSSCKKNPNSQQRLSCICGSTFSRKDSLLTHHKTCPSQQLSSQRTDSLKFSSQGEFHTWKDNEEIKTLSYFSKQRATIGPYTYYYCQHDGSDKPHRKSSEPARKTSRKKKIGQIKKNATCPARISVKQEGSSLNVRYNGMHNHPLIRNDLAHQPATFSMSSHINKQIALNIPAKDIYQSLETVELERENRSKQTASVHGDRNLMITERSIKQRVSKIKKKSKHHEDDSTSVFHLVNELKQETYSPILLYKPCGMDIQVGPDDKSCLTEEFCSSEDFVNLYMIGLQTKEQRGELNTLIQFKAHHKLNQNLERIKQLVEQNDLSPHLLQSSNTLLEQLIRRIEAETDSSPLGLESFPKGRKINPREKLATQESQLLPFKQKKKRKSKTDDDDGMTKRKRQEAARDALILACLNSKDPNE